LTPIGVYLAAIGFVVANNRMRQMDKDKTPTTWRKIEK